MGALQHEARHLYRRDIDGLRAVAVSSVMLYHAGLKWTGGGFVGVDVFFVISGFLITRILIADMDGNQFSILRFYDRRVRRIVPALGLMVFGVTAAALVVLTPFALEHFGRSLVSAALFSSNVFFWKARTNYFAAPAHTEILLHTWSLAIEEQFYILWPLVLWTLARSALRRWLLPACAALTLVSLAISEYAAQNYAGVAFYLLPSRGWELALGAFLASPTLPKPRARAASELASAAGLLLILYSVVVYRVDTPFPGLHALAPAGGAALLIYAGEGTWTGLLLSARPVVFIGLISYSLYLWHWPALSLTRAYLDRELRPIEIVTALGTCTLIAVISTRFVELPFRRSRGWTANRGLPASVRVGAVMLVLFVAMGTILVLTRGLPARGPEAAVAAERVLREPREVQPYCGVYDVRMAGFTSCRSRPVLPTIALWGDSHASRLAKALATRARDTKGSILFLIHAGCPPAIGANHVHGRLLDPGCREFTTRATEELRRYPSISTLVLASRWSFYAENRVEGEEMFTDYLTDDSNSERSLDNSRRVLRESVDRTVSLAERLNMRVSIINQVPEWGADPARCIAHARWWRSSESRCFAPTARVRARLAASTAILRDVATAHPGVTLIDPLPLFCDDELCRSVMAGELLYGDDHHLSLAGSQYLLRHLGIDWDPPSRLQPDSAVTIPSNLAPQ